MFVKLRIRMPDGEERVEVLNLSPRTKVREALEALGLNPMEFLVVKGKKVVYDEVELEDGEEFLVIPAVSGG